MRKLFIGLVLFSLVACQPDASLRNELVGKWKVSIAADSSGQTNLTEAVQQAVDSGMEKASKEIEAAMDSIDVDLTIESKGETKKLNNNSLGEGLKAFAKGMGELFKGLAELGKGLATLIQDLAEVNVELKSDGSMQFSSPNDEMDVELNEEQLKWSIADGKFLLESESEVDTFSIERLDEGFLLIGKEAKFKLSALDQNKK